MKTLIIIVIIAFAAFFGYQFYSDNSSDGEVMEESMEKGEMVEENGLDTTMISAEVVADDAVLLDVRTDTERVEDGYAINSIHFDLARLEAGELPDILKSQKIYTYCKGGVRAGKAKDILESNGYTDVVNIGGLSDWEAAGGTVVR